MALVVHVVPATDNAGAENQARYLIDGLRGRGAWELEVVYFEPGRAQREYESLGVPLHQVSPQRRLALDWRRRVRGIRGLYRDHPPAIVHGWLDVGNLLATLAAKRWPLTKVVISQRCASDAYRNAPYWPWALRAIRNRVDHAVANSVDGSRFLRELGYPTARTSVIRNGIPWAPSSPEARSDARAAASRELGIGTGAPTVGFVGRADEMKDLGTLFSAMERVQAAVPAAQLVLVGPSRQEIEQLGLRLPQHATALGWTSAPARLMPRLDVLALSSRTEGHSNAVDEGLLAGVAVATTAVGDHPQLVERCGGRVVPVGRSDLLGEALIELLRRPPDPALVSGTAAQVLTMEPVLDTVEELYRNLLGAGSQAERGASPPDLLRLSP